jgi:chemotaxis protein methyltransferase CheR
MTLASTDLTFVANLVRRESAIVLGPEKDYLIEARLQPVARETGATDVADLVARMQRTPDPAVRQRVVEALTTNETSWFRDREPFAALSDAVLPDLVSSRGASPRRLRLWSAACSSGQEPYSLAIEMQRSLPAGWGYDIVASDISTQMLDRARKGEFSQVEVNRGLPVQVLMENFERIGAYWRITPNLRRSVTFEHLNLAGVVPPMGPFDVIFLRNVLIYFDVETKRSVLRNVARMLRPDGWLFLGSAETTIGLDDNYVRVAAGRTSAYRLRTTVATATAGKG